MAQRYGGLNRGWNMKVYGLKELTQLMRELPATTRRTVTINAMRASAKPMLAAAKNNVPDQSGALAMSIGLKAMSKRIMLRGGGDSFAGMTLSPLHRIAAWHRWATWHGRETNLLRKNPRTGKVGLDPGAIGRIRHGHLVEFGFRHPNGEQVEARPFLRKAFDQQSGAFLAVFKKRLAIRVRNAIRKHRATTRGRR